MSTRPNDALYTEDGLIAAVAEAHANDRELSDDEARAVASAWHGGQSSAFYSFASSGYYDRDGLFRELSRNIEQSYHRISAADRLTLDMLGTYLLNRAA